MAFHDLINNGLGEWMKGTGPGRDVVISSRIRLARNIQGIPFPATASQEQLSHILSLAQSACDTKAEIGTLEFLPMAQISPLERQILVERHLISPQHTQNTAFKGVALRGDQAISVMINEEDHFRLQILAPGLNLEAAWQLATRLDDHYDEQVEYAFSQELGYLSACPTNLGTGLRASVMIHLPALTALGQVQRVLADVNRFGLAVRGLYGEGTEAVGNIYQLSNQVTLGLAEEEIINHLENITGQIIDQERRAREHLLTVNKGALEDGIYRSYGILAYARRVSSQEAMEHLSKVRLGIDLELIQGLEPQILQEILVMIRPAHLQRLVGKDMEAEERDYHRATLIREKLKV